MQSANLKDKTKNLIMRGVIPDSIKAFSTVDSLLNAVDVLEDKYSVNKLNKAKIFAQDLSAIDEYIFVLFELVDELNDEWDINTATINFLHKIKNELIGNQYDYFKDLLIEFSKKWLKKNSGHKWIGFEEKYVKYICSRKYLSSTVLQIMLVQRLFRHDDSSETLNFITRDKDMVESLSANKYGMFTWINYDILRFDGNTHYVNMSGNVDQDKIKELKIMWSAFNVDVEKIIDSLSYFIIEDELIKMVWNAICKMPDTFKEKFI